MATPSISKVGSYLDLLKPPPASPILAPGDILQILSSNPSLLEVFLTHLPEELVTTHAEAIEAIISRVSPDRTPLPPTVVKIVKRATLILLGREIRNHLNEQLESSDNIGKTADIVRDACIRYSTQFPLKSTLLIAKNLVGNNPEQLTALLVDSLVFYIEDLRKNFTVLNPEEVKHRITITFDFLNALEIEPDQAPDVQHTLHRFTKVLGQQVFQGLKNKDLHELSKPIQLMNHLRSSLPRLQLVQEAIAATEENLTRHLFIKDSRDLIAPSCNQLTTLCKLIDLIEALKASKNVTLQMFVKTFDKVFLLSRGLLHNFATPERQGILFRSMSQVLKVNINFACRHFNKKMATQLVDLRDSENSQSLKRLPILMDFISNVLGISVKVESKMATENADIIQLLYQILSIVYDDPAGELLPVIQNWIEAHEADDLEGFQNWLEEGIRSKRVFVAPEPHPKCLYLAFLKSKQQ